MRKIRSIFVLCVLGILLISTSCHNAFNECLSGTGDKSTETRKMYPFYSIEVYDNINLDIRQADDFALVITAGEKLLPMISTSIDGYRLKICNESVCTLFKEPWEMIDIEVLMPDLDSLFVHSQGKIKLRDGFTSRSLYVFVTKSAASLSLDVDLWDFCLHNGNGTADILVSGSTRDAFIYNGGYGPVDCLALKSVFMIVNSNSTNHSWVQAGQKLLDAKITFSGNIYYQGEPDTIIQSILGSGRLLKID